MFWCFTLLSFAAFYTQIPDIYHPSFADYRAVQRYIQRKDRPELKLLKTAISPGGNLQGYNCRARQLRLIGAVPWELPKYEVVPMRTSLKDKKVAVCTYASYNKNYPKGVKLLQAALERIGFKGHFVYRIGGWPDVEGGSLPLAHVPYAFKPCFLRELARQGYEQVLWLDASIRPQKKLDAVFQTIERQGYFLHPAGHTLAQYCTREAMEALGEAPENADKVASVAAGVFGINLVHPIGKEIAQRWYDAAKQETPFFSPRPEQNALSIIVHQLGLTAWATVVLVWEEAKLNEATQFFIDWKSIQ